MNRRNIGGSILPSSDPQILKPMPGKLGTLQVVPVPALDTHALTLVRADGEGVTVLATHANGYSCHHLAQRLLDAWDGKREPSYALEQFDYILRCGGLGRDRAAFAEWAQKATA